ncbi:hypothetical protein DLM_3976 [Aquitalea magnusonii]|uniref:Uncharacterized protein n=1 Tax=Aquitalea magnusonii TaxID=332411 RepID=A0A3G9GJ48_9NEIS|nr:hypothetical protein DLM_3976 [Aquitalea magnusonii]
MKTPVTKINGQQAAWCWQSIRRRLLAENRGIAPLAAGLPGDWFDRGSDASRFFPVPDARAANLPNKQAAS